MSTEKSTRKRKVTKRDGADKIPPAREYASDTQAAAMFDVSRRTVWLWTKTDETFPKPIKLSEGATRWRTAELLAWAESKARAA